MCSVMSKNVTSAVSRRMQAQKSVAVNVGFAFFRSLYVCSMLLGILESGFVLSGFIMRHLVENPIQTTEALNFDYTKSSPVAFVPLMSSSRVSSDCAIPYNHKLQLAVSLTAPESEYNHKLGVFQTKDCAIPYNHKLQLAVSLTAPESEYNHKLGKDRVSSHPCMVRYKSGPIHFIETFLKTAPLIAGLQSETQVLNIKMSGHIEGLELTACLKVILEQRAEFQNGAGIPQIYSASLVHESELPRSKRPIIVPRGRPKIGYSTKKFDHSNIIVWQKSSYVLPRNTK
ncbi:hypothetical protein C1H46_011300 [Malus baccata]|uniref:Uncharacterized protein n=1 Tax=Malus baccata TaxID=106549 RepID=A0A540MWJ9_MALBA|nr:hypothetical protein C1H46_011300 [Malus baccata]